MLHGASLVWSLLLREVNNKNNLLHPKAYILSSNSFMKPHVNDFFPNTIKQKFDVLLVLLKIWSHFYGHHQAVSIITVLLINTTYLFNFVKWIKNLYTGVQLRMLIEVNTFWLYDLMILYLSVSFLLFFYVLILSYPYLVFVFLFSIVFIRNI